jgi:uncharacterized protein (TIGR03435 family)
MRKSLVLNVLLAVRLFAQVRPSVEVASIKPSAATVAGAISVSPGTFSVTNLPLRRLIQNAYGVRDFQISGGPSWINAQGWDIVATAKELNGNNFLLTLQTFLEDRFQLRVHREVKDGPVYELALAASGMKMQPTASGNCFVIDLNNPRLSTETRPSCGSWQGSRPGLRNGVGVSMTDLPGPPFQSLSGQFTLLLGRPVLDRTGLVGLFDIRLEWTPDELAAGATDGPSIFSAVREQLGLELKSVRGPVNVLVIDGVDRPSEN